MQNETVGNNWEVGKVPEKGKIEGELIYGVGVINFIIQISNSTIAYLFPISNNIYISYEKKRWC